MKVAPLIGRERVAARARSRPLGKRSAHGCQGSTTEQLQPMARKASKLMPSTYAPEREPRAIGCLRIHDNETERSPGFGRGIFRFPGLPASVAAWLSLCRDRYGICRTCAQFPVGEQRYGRSHRYCSCRPERPPERGARRHGSTGAREHGCAGRGGADRLAVRGHERR